MTEANGQPAPSNVLPLTDSGEALRQSALEAVRTLDPELLERSDTRHLVEMGAQLIGEVTQEHGSPDHPLWYAGTVENRPMTYHNGGEDGHTSAGERGVGVPRATLLIAAEVNSAAGREVYSPLDRATNFYAASAHDLVQNCGRALLDEGRQGEGYGDERLSAEAARDRLLAGGGEAAAQIDPATPQHAYDRVMVTAFNPVTKTQNINYEAFEANPDDPAVQRSVLGQEAVAAADLLSLTHIRGPVGSVENIVEVLASNVSDRALQQALEDAGVSTTGEADMGQILDVIGGNDALRARFIQQMDGQAGFFGGFQFSDRAIRAATGGRGIDDLFPGRAENAAVLAGFAEEMRAGNASPRQVWEQARIRAGYQS